MRAMWSLIVAAAVTADGAPQAARRAPQSVMAEAYWATGAVPQGTRVSDVDHPPALMRREALPASAPRGRPDAGAPPGVVALEGGALHAGQQPAGSSGQRGIKQTAQQSHRGWFFCAAVAVIVIFALLTLSSNVLQALNRSVAASETPESGTTEPQGDEAADSQPTPSSAPAEAAGAGALPAVSSADIEKPFRISRDPLDEDLYGLATTMIVRDAEKVLRGSQAGPLRMVRMAISVLCLAFSMTLQMYLIYEVRLLVTAESVHDIRKIYDKFEWVMYGRQERNLEQTVNGFHRGIAQHYNSENFARLTATDKGVICKIPLSQPTFFVTILLVWTFTVVIDVRKAVDLCIRLVFVVPSIDSMRDATMPLDDDFDVLIVGLTRAVKGVLFTCLFVPRLLVSVSLLWLGCRWLASSPNFEDLVLNSIALEFVLNLNTIIFMAMVPERNKYETRLTFVKPLAPEQPATAWNMLSTFFWGVAGLIWVLVYVYDLQQVLPDYRWDVQAVCAGYLNELAGRTDSH